MAHFDETMIPSATGIGGDLNPYDVVIIGGGVVGLSILRSSVLGGIRAAVVESQPHLLSGASGRNSGIACTGVDASLGSLERALIRDSMSQIKPFCHEFRLPMRECGSLVCLWPWDEKDGVAGSKLGAVAEESWEAGDMDARILDGSNVLEMEPSLNSECRGAVHIPGEIVLDPWLVPVAMASHARENGGDIFTEFSFDVQRSSFDEDTKLWKILPDSSTKDGPTKLFARAIVNAAGIHCDAIQYNVTDVPKPHWEVRPRRGQYRIFESSSRPVLTRPIQPVPTQFTKGIFVYSTLYNHIVVGPTAEDQDSRTDDSINGSVRETLTSHIAKILPAESLTPIGEYVGIRPGTNCRDYQITPFFNQKWISVAGIRSTGLTASLGIGRHVVNCLLMPMLGIVPSLKQPKSKLTPLPPLQQMISEFHSRGDGKVTINGFTYTVTHPITRIGWEAQSGLAKQTTDGN